MEQLSRPLLMLLNGLCDSNARSFVSPPLMRNKSGPAHFGFCALARVPREETHRMHSNIQTWSIHSDPLPLPPLPTIMQCTTEGDAPIPTCLRVQPS
jgi:hypothetical protein